MLGTMWVKVWLVVLMAIGGVASCSSQQNPSEGVGTSPGAGNEGDRPAARECVRSGCSGTVCVERGQEVITTCEFKPEYACYEDALCEPQPDGSCGWTPSATLEKCLASPPAATLR